MTASRQVGAILERSEREPESLTEDEYEEEEAHLKDEEICVVDTEQGCRDEYMKPIRCDIEGINSLSCISQIDTGCPISLIKEQLVSDAKFAKSGREWNGYHGINKSRLRIIGVIRANVTLEDITKPVTFGVVGNSVMSSNALLGRDVLKLFGYRLTKSPIYDEAARQILNIDVDLNDQADRIYINPEIPLSDRLNFKTVFTESYCLPQRPKEPKVKGEADIKLRDNQLIQIGPRRLGFADKAKVQETLDDLLDRGIIRPNKSEYSSPIVLTRKKNGETRMCVDYRALNKVIARDNYPLPLIEDQLDTLRGK